MTRFALLGALAFAALLPAAVAQPAPAPAPPPSAPGGLQIIDAKVVKGQLIWTETTAVPVVKEIEVLVNVNGKQVPVKQRITVHEVVPVTKANDLKGATVTDGAGKAIGADKLAERLKETTPVVLLSGALPAKYRSLFKDTTVFIEFPPPPAPKGPAPLPPVVVPAPGGAPPVALPPGEKKG